MKFTLSTTEAKQILKDKLPSPISVENKSENWSSKTELTEEIITIKPKQ